MSKILVIGGGASGMMSAIFAARNGNEVHIFEKNEKFGKKIYITGKGRCNLTNACDTEELLQAVCRNSKFLYSSFYGFSSQDAIDFFEKSGCPVKIERGNRAFPVSDHSSDVIRALVEQMKKAGVHTHLNCAVTGLICQENGVRGVKINNHEEIYADKLIVASGGLSYPSTGSDGDGYRFARELGLTVMKTSPSIVPLEIKEEDPKRMQGLSLKNIEITIEKQKQDLKKTSCLYRGFGEMLFTHFGVSGPLILTGSSYVTEAMLKEKDKDVTYRLYIDLKPALSEEQLDARMLRDFDANPNKSFNNVLSGLLPSKMIPVLVEHSGIPENMKIHEITKAQRQSFVRLLKKYPLTITGTRSYQEAVITKGGISVKEINPSTMESKKYPGLFFTGEVLDLDAVTGGYNLQIAWSTGYAAGCSV